MSALTMALAQVDSRRGLDDKLWEIFAYGARYGKQPLSELRGMTLAELAKFVEAVSKIVQHENRHEE